jgi:hypothetical protein
MRRLAALIVALCALGACAPEATPRAGSGAITPRGDATGVSDTAGTATVDAIDSFVSCAAAGYPIMESFPRQCRTPDGRLFVEDVTPPPVDPGATAFEDLIVVRNPAPGALVTSPISIEGEARGTWYFEATFPLRLETLTGEVIATGYAEALGEWMTEDFVPFTGRLEFDPPVEAEGVLIVEKSNPSGLPEHAAEFSVPVRFHSP